MQQQDRCHTIKNTSICYIPGMVHMRSLTGMTVFGFHQADGKQVERCGGAEPKQRFCLNGMMALSRGWLWADSGVRSISQIATFFRRLMAPAFQLILSNPLWAWRGQNIPLNVFSTISPNVQFWCLNKVVFFFLRWGQSASCLILLYCLYSVWLKDIHRAKYSSSSLTCASW